MLTHRFVHSLLLLTACLAAESCRADSPWQFTDIDGTMHKPFDDKSTKAIGLVFISTDCPIANSYQPELHRLADAYRQNGIQFFMIHPDPQTATDKARQHALEFDIQVPIVIDTEQKISRRVGATVTPQVFVFLRDQATPAYQGRIDNLYADYGKKRVAATTHDLADAMAAIVAGKKVERPKTEAIGCFISLQEKPSVTPAPESSTYDPLKILDEKIETLELVVEDQNRSREIPLLVYLPKSTEPAAVIVHSHGLGGTKETSPFLGQHWASRGFLAVFVQHPGSDDGIWKNVPALRRMTEMKKAASGQNLNLRTGDVPAIIDQLEVWNADKSHPLYRRFNLERIGMSGHSFGALTTQYIGGQNVLGTPRYADTRIKASIPMSPSAPRIGDANKVFGKVQIPWLCMTGTRDVSVIGDADLESRLSVFPALSAGDKYELVLDEAEHSVFTDRALLNDTQARNPNHHRAILAISTAFWDSYLRGDAAAKKWLNSEAVRDVLETKDRWQKK